MRKGAIQKCKEVKGGIRVKEDIQKMCFDYLVIEITRRCNLSCAHCLRGDPQELDISNEIIDNLLEQTEKIYGLFLSGGEPTLNLETMRYILERLQASKIPLYSVELFTNGVIHSAELVSILKDYAKYIKRWLSPYKNITDHVWLGVSVDPYHVGYNPQLAIDYYSRELADIARVRAEINGNLPIKRGRARTMPGASERPTLFSIPHQIHTYMPGKPCGCKYAAKWRDAQVGQKVICCGLYLTAKGDIELFNAYDTGEYEIEDNNRDLVICNISPETDQASRNIDKGIQRYNLDKISCVVAERQSAEAQSKEYQDNPSLLIKDVLDGWDMLTSRPDEMEAFKKNNPLAMQVLPEYIELFRELREMQPLIDWYTAKQKESDNSQNKKGTGKGK